MKQAGYTLLALSFLASISVAQIQQQRISTTSESVRITFQPNPLQPKIVELNGSKAVQFDNWFDESAPGDYALPREVVTVAIPAGAKASLRLNREEYKQIANLPPVRNPQLGSIGDTAYSYDFNAPAPGASELKPTARIAGYGWVRNFYCAFVEVQKYRYLDEANSLEELFELDFELVFDSPVQAPALLSSSREDMIAREMILNYDQARGWESQQPIKEGILAANDWIDYSRSYVKLAVGEDGIYRITGSDLVQLGVDLTGLDPATFALYEGGEQVPISVRSFGAVPFGINDYVEFVGEKNYSDGDHRAPTGPDEDAVNFLDRYTDSTIYWLTWGGAPGLRNEVSSPATLPADTLDFSMRLVRLEQDIWHFEADPLLANRQFPNWHNKYPAWQSVKPRTMDFNFGVSDIAIDAANPSGQVIEATTYAKVQSESAVQVSPAHDIRIYLGDEPEPLDTALLDRGEMYILSGEIEPWKLTDGATRIKFESAPTLSNPNRVVIDWLELEYPRLNIAYQNRMYLKMATKRAVPIYVTVKVTGFTQSPTSILKKTGVGKSIESFTVVDEGAEFAVYFADSVSDGDIYCIASDQGAMKPTIHYMRDPATNPFANLFETGRSNEYMVVTHSSVEEVANEYADFIGQQFGVSTGVYAMREIIDEFSYGYFKPEAVRDFLNYAFVNWASPKPEYLFIIGDAQYDYKDFAFKNNGEKPVRARQLVPSIGLPVSDALLVMWENTPTSVPQMLHGRVPAINEADVRSYLDRHRAYYEAPHSDWNKRYLMFSGGDVNNPVELNLLYQKNEELKKDIFESIPVSGRATHFYKTTNPPTNFGPYPSTFFVERVNEGGVFISYLGHSGTSTWDNGISTVEQLDNETNRSSVVTDFGCSTARFAESETVSFSEQFTVGENANSLAYVGNSSLGYLSVSETLPYIFYRTVLQDSVYTLGMAHLKAKTELLQRFGSSNSNQIAMRTNMLVGDPILSVAVPRKPNFNIAEEDVVRLTSNITVATDSAYFALHVGNNGSSMDASLEILIEHIVSDTLYGTRTLVIPAPGLVDTVSIAFPAFQLLGEHRFTVTLDPNNQFDEIDELDNEVTIAFTVVTAQVTHVGGFSAARVLKDELVLLNPFSAPELQNDSTLYIQFSQSPLFIAPTEMTLPFDTIVTRVPLASLQMESRYFYRYRLDPSAVWEGPFSFYHSNIDAKLTYRDTLAINEGRTSYLSYENGEYSLAPKEIAISVASAGFQAGRFAVMDYDGISKISLGVPVGYYVLMLDGDSKEIIHESVQYNILGDRKLADSMAAHLDSFPAGTIALMAISDEGSIGLTDNLKRAIRAYGSEFIDSVSFRDSWCIFGVKGLAQGQANEDYQPLLNFKPAAIDTLVTVKSEFGTIELANVGKARKWQRIEKQGANAQLLTTVEGVRQNFTSEVLQTDVPDQVQDIATVNALEFPNLNLETRVNFIDQNQPVTGLQLDIDFVEPAELAMNYQSVALSNDSPDQGETVTAQVTILNAGEYTAENAVVEFYVRDPSNQKTLLTSSTIPPLAAGEKYYETVPIDTKTIVGPSEFIVEVDNNRAVLEITRANNVLTVPFHVRGDSSAPRMDVTFDGIIPFDGDYVSPTPEVVVTLLDDGALDSRDINNFVVVLNDTLVINNPEYNVVFDPGSGEVQGIVTFYPVLEDGQHFFEFNVKDAAGNFADSANLEIYVIVESDTKIMDLYNYPNPFADETAFAFNMTGTQPPEEFAIKIYTLNGRLIREIIVPPNGLRVGFNRIPWDGRDEDRDLLANGTYLYKVDYTIGGNTSSILGKLSVLR